MVGNAYVTGAMHSTDIQSVVAQVDTRGMMHWEITLDGVVGCAAAVTQKYLYFPVTTNYTRMLYQLSHAGKTEEIEVLPKIAFTPYAPIIDNFGRVILPNRYGSQLFVYESDVVGKIF